MDVVSRLVLPFGTFNVQWTKTKYINGALAIVGNVYETGEPFCKLSVNFGEDSIRLQNDLFYVKDWSENKPIIKALEDSPLFSLEGENAIGVIWKANF